eukprot:2795829-Prymnesium_polylepis.1
MSASLADDLAGWIAQCTAPQAIEADAPPLPRDTRTALRLSVELRRKLGHGSTLNVRVLVRGDLQTGKTSLFRRMQGLAYAPALASTGAIGVGHVDWCPEWCEDRVKLEVWDVVDSATVLRSEPKGLQSEHRTAAAATDGAAPEPRDPASDAPPALDASGVDVFRDAHAMVLLVDQRKRWTLEYAQRQLGSAPDALPVLLLSNFGDVVGAPGASLAFEWAEVAALAAAESERSGR